MRIFRFAGTIVSALAIVIAAPAFANQFVGAYAGHFDYHAPPPNSVEVQQTIWAPGTGPAVAATTGTGWNNFASTDYGVLKFRASESSLGAGSTQDVASTNYEDVIVINAGAPGTSGVATFQMHLTGTLFATGGGYWDIGVRNYGTSIYTRSSSIWGSGTFAIDDILTFVVPYVSGRATDIGASAYAYAGVFNSPGSAYADFSHTASWLGLRSAVTNGGQNVTQGATISSSSGFNYRLAAPGVPEPAVWAQLLVGFGLAGGAIRVRRRKTA